MQVSYLQKLNPWRTQNVSTVSLQNKTKTRGWQKCWTQGLKTEPKHQWVTSWCLYPLFIQTMVKQWYSICLSGGFCVLFVKFVVVFLTCWRLDICIQLFQHIWLVKPHPNTKYWSTALCSRSNKTFIRFDNPKLHILSCEVVLLWAAQWQIWCNHEDFFLTCWQRVRALWYESVYLCVLMITEIYLSWDNLQEKFFSVKVSSIKESNLGLNQRHIGLCLCGPETHGKLYVTVKCRTDFML